MAWFGAYILLSFPLDVYEHESEIHYLGIRSYQAYVQGDKNTSRALYLHFPPTLETNLQTTPRPLNADGIDDAP